MTTEDRQWTAPTTNKIAGKVVKCVYTGRTGVATDALPGCRRLVSVNWDDGDITVMFINSLKIALN